MAANAAMVLFYWDIGRLILERQERAGWGAKVIDRLSADLPRGLSGHEGAVATQPEVHACLCRRVAGAGNRARGSCTNALVPPPYLFDFLGTADPRREREVEQALVDHIQRFLLELGQGFAFVGRQVQLAFASRDYFLDLLFYHLKLRCYVVIELKAVPFDPAFIGQINVYLSAVDDLLRHPGDQPAIGLLLCRSKDKIVVEYALRDLKKPIGVAGWETMIVEKLPENLKGSLPTVEELEAELSRGENER